MEVAELWRGLGWPLVRLSLTISLGLLVANLIEALNWTRAVAKLAEPLIRLARLKDVSGASFSMAFFSGVAANTMLSEAYDKGALSRRELILSNLFNSLPTYFLHLPSMFFLVVPFLGSAAFVYVGLTLLSAILRTSFIVALGRVWLPPLPEGCVVCRLDEAAKAQGARTWRDALRISIKRFKKRIGKVLTFTVPIYILVFFLNRWGVFKMLEGFLAEHAGILSWLHPKAISIVVFQVASEFTAGLAAAGALLEAQALPMKQVVLALLVGNVLSTPMRAFRHQFPFYAGIFKPALATRLIAASQALRAGSIVVVTALYFFLIP
ncbi:hypothetical protein V6C53_09845 [Desulfocurvibacter africanus]|uniref:membrane protein n=1 Tax=Desulfocurvibacter africanus TaxID=873 RepID=UPI0004850AA9|nr:membrane protein [Desulfocurvibacter africanus]